ncbi:hypothetical protein JZX86_05875 [Agrobacterium rosae]|uniref:hypothetical protein n=1 Tax=Agrobacterium rosae TaxID=1972867 RepID=UPI0019D400B2|nr:hypothetical protein [Agrobacterium rosae]MBN7804892.1 hypothetical protein [Agrobacterium rosae]
MGEVLTMSGTPLMRCREVLQAVSARDDVEHIVIVVERTDGMREVYYDRQDGEKVAFAAAVISSVASDLARGATIEE